MQETRVSERGCMILVEEALLEVLLIAHSE
jgi:hypothetical protein